LDVTTAVYAPTFPLDSQVLVHSHAPPHKATIIGTPSYSRPDIHTVKFHDNSIAEYSLSDNILETLPLSSSIPSMSLLPDWVKGGSTATLFLTEMSKPKHGRLYMHDDNQWYFCFSNTSDITKGVLLSDLPANCQRLLDSGQLFRGHTKFSRVYQV